MGQNRRTNDEMFDLGTWVGSALTDISAAKTETTSDDTLALLHTLSDFLASAKDARNWAALEELRRHWDVNHNGSVQ